MASCRPGGAVEQIVQFVDGIVSRPVVLSVIAISAALPILYTHPGKRIMWVAPSRVLVGYSVLTVLSLLALGLLGPLLHKINPYLFEVWRQDLKFLRGNNLATILAELSLSLPFAFAISSFLYGALSSWYDFVHGLFGVLLGLILALAVLFVAFMVTWYLWSPYQ